MVPRGPRWSPEVPKTDNFLVCSKKYSGGALRNCPPHMTSMVCTSVTLTMALPGYVQHYTLTRGADTPYCGLLSIWDADRTYVRCYVPFRVPLLSNSAYYHCHLGPAKLSVARMFLHFQLQDEQSYWLRIPFLSCMSCRHGSSPTSGLEHKCKT